MSECRKLPENRVYPREKSGIPSRRNGYTLERKWVYSIFCFCQQIVFPDSGRKV